MQSGCKDIRIIKCEFGTKTTFYIMANVSVSVSVYRKGPSLCARILNEKSTFSPATVVFEK